MIGKRLRIYCDAEDIRVLRAFLADRTELGELKAGGLWSMTPHLLDVRKRIFKAKRLSRLRFGKWDDPVQVYLDFKRGKAKRSRKVASEIAQIKERSQTGQRTLSEPTPALANPLRRCSPIGAGPQLIPDDRTGDCNQYGYRSGHHRSSRLDA